MPWVLEQRGCMITPLRQRQVLVIRNARCTMECWRSIGVRELRQNASRYLEEVAGGVDRGPLAHDANDPNGFSALAMRRVKESSDTLLGGPSSCWESGALLPPTDVRLSHPVYPARLLRAARRRGQMATLVPQAAA